MQLATIWLESEQVLVSRVESGVLWAESLTHLIAMAQAVIGLKMLRNGSR